MLRRSTAALAFALVAVACGRVVDEGRDASELDAASDGALGLAPDSYSPDAAQTPEAGALPTIACDDAGDCPLPPSTCLDSQWLEYFDNGKCGSNGTCAYDTVVARCDWGCFDAGCGSRITTPNAPSP